MNTKTRFLRMAELEKRLAELVETGWDVRRVVYDDEEGEPFHVTVTLTTTSLDTEEAII